MTLLSSPSSVWTDSAEGERTLSLACAGMERSKDTAPPGHEAHFRAVVQDLIHRFQDSGQSELAAVWSDKLAVWETASGLKP